MIATYWIRKDGKWENVSMVTYGAQTDNRASVQEIDGSTIIYLEGYLESSDHKTLLAAHKKITKPAASKSKKKTTSKIKSGKE